MFNSWCSKKLFIYFACRIFLESVNIENHDDQTTSNVFPDLAKPKLNLTKPTPTNVFHGSKSLTSKDVNE